MGTEGPRELEMKFRCDDHVMTALLQAPLVRRWQQGPWQKKPVRTTYFDTGAGALAQAGLVLRLRKDGKKLLQSIKSKGSNGSFFLDRFEVETELPDGSPFPQKLYKSFTHRLDEHLETLKPDLRPYLRTDITRLACDLRFGDAVMQLVLDRGAGIFWPSKSAPRQVALKEVELELLSGSPHDFYWFASTLSGSFPLVPSHLSKEKRTYLARTGGKIEKQTVPLPVFQHHTPLWSVYQGGLMRGAGLVTQNLEPFREGDQKALKKVRQGLRRLAVASRAIPRKKQVPIPAVIIPELKQTRDNLGLARDWHVLLEKTLPRVKGQLPASDPRYGQVCTLIDHARRRHQICWREAGKAIGNPDLVARVLRLAGWAQASAPAKSSRQKPARLRGSKLLERRLHRARLMLEAVRPGNATSFHEARKSIRKLRHTGQLFLGCFHQPTEENYLAEARALQDQFGKYQDMARAIELLCSLSYTPEGRGRSENPPIRDVGMALRGARYTVAHLQRSMEQAEPDLCASAQAFLACKPYWR